VLDRGCWRPAPVFGLIGALGGVAQDELERALNMGVGMVAVVDPAHADAALRMLRERGVPAWALGEVVAGSGRARLTGTHPA
jgi:phosphoribosylformylglycinamidine cyclo-ligase